MIPDQFELFLNAVSEYLYSDGWYTQSHNVKKKKTKQEVLEYLEFHCYDEEEAEDVIAKCEMLSGQAFTWLDEETGSD